jgi:hypothetical protein
VFAQSSGYTLLRKNDENEEGAVKGENMQEGKALLFTFLFIILLASLGVAADKSAGERTFRAKLSGSEEVPFVNTEAEGEAAFQISGGGDTLTYKLTISHIKDVTAVYIHRGKKGEKGPPVADLFGEPKKENISGTLLVEGKVEPYLLIGPLKGKSLKSLVQLIEAREAYINILTKKHSEGEIRGQIR